MSADLPSPALSAGARGSANAEAEPRAACNGSSGLVGAGGAYRAILADPPWDYGCTSPTGNQTIGKPGACGVGYYYPTMKLAEICAMPVAEMAAPESCLFLWATVPLLPEAFEVMKAWGYRYKTMLTWNKVNGHGMGYWFRGHTEHLLLGIRGDVKAFRSRRRNLIDCKVGRHSAKPEQFHEIVEEVCQPPYLELFSRRARKGWSHFGNDVEHDLFSLGGGGAEHGERNGAQQGGPSSPN